MAEDTLKIKWEPTSRKKLDTMIEKIPLFHREIAKTVVENKAILNAQERDSSMVEEEDIVRAFFTEVPMAFYSLMIRLFEEVGFDYKPYEPN